jgi:hypothetical protein
MYFVYVVDADDVSDSQLTLFLSIMHMLIMRSYRCQIFNLFGKYLWVRLVKVLC